MTTILRTLSLAFAAVSLALLASHAVAQSRATVVAAPAKLQTRAAVEPVVAVPVAATLLDAAVRVAAVPVAVLPVTTACTPIPGYPCDAPTPLPPGAGNSCYRGNSAGVSRCPS